MINALDDCQRLVTSALEASSVAVESTAPGRWNIALLHSSPLRTHVRLDDGWVLFDAGPIAVPLPGLCWPLLALNRALPPLAKYASSDGCSWHVTAQAPLAESIDVTRMVRDTAAAVAHGLAWLCAQPLPLSVAPAPDAPLHLENLCAGSSWPFRMRDDEAALVTLETGSGFQQALVAVEPALGAVAAVPLLADIDVGDLPTPCRDALGLLLLRVCSAVRMVRVAADAHQPPARLEVALGHAAAPEGLAHALAALSLAFRLCAREAALLARDERIAERYVAATLPAMDVSLACDQRETPRAA